MPGVSAGKPPLCCVRGRRSDDTRPPWGNSVCVCVCVCVCVLLFFPPHPPAGGLGGGSPPTRGVWGAGAPQGAKPHINTTHPLAQPEDGSQRLNERNNGWRNRIEAQGGTFVALDFHSAVAHLGDQK